MKNSSPQPLQFVSIAFGRQLDFEESINTETIFDEDNLTERYGLKNNFVMKSYENLATVFNLMDKRYLFVSFTLFSYETINMRNFKFESDDYLFGVFETFSYSNIDFAPLTDKDEFLIMLQDQYSNHSKLHSKFIIEHYEILEGVNQLDNEFE